MSETAHMKLAKMLAASQRSNTFRVPRELAKDLVAERSRLQSEMASVTAEALMIIIQKNDEANAATRDRVKELEDERSESIAELSLLYDLWVGIDDPRAARDEVIRMRDKLALAEARVERLEAGRLPELED